MVKDALFRWLSWLWPLPKARAQGRFGALEVRYEQGRAVLNSANGNQSFGSLHRVWQVAFQRIGLARTPPANVLLLGLGGGSVPHILIKELQLSPRITAVEIDPAMVELAKVHFGGTSWTGTNIVEADALMHVHIDRERYDLVVVDLFEDLEMARGIDTSGFAHALRDRCTGTLLFNTVGYDPESQRRCDRTAQQLDKVFASVDELRLEGVNRVFIAR